METLKARIEQDGITADVLYVGPRTTEDGWDHIEYAVTLRDPDGGEFTTPFKMGTALGRPDAETVLNSLISDAATIENNQSFEDWAAELGFDSASRKAEAVFGQAAEQTDALRAFLGDRYETYLWETEQL